MLDWIIKQAHFHSDEGHLHLHVKVKLWIKMLIYFNMPGLQLR